MYICTKDSNNNPLGRHPNPTPAQRKYIASTSAFFLCPSGLCLPFRGSHCLVIVLTRYRAEVPTPPACT